MDNIHIKQNQNITQNLLLSLTMQKSLFILQLPVLELATFIEQELALNPLVEVEERTTECSNPQNRKGLLGSNIAESQIAPRGLFSHYMHQVHLAFSSKKDLWIAEQLLGSVNEKGILEEIPEVLIEFFSASCINHVLHQIQMMDPPGICARNERECLLIQLRALHKDKSITYEILSHNYTELLEQKFSFLEKKYKIPAKKILQTIKNDCRSLDPFPGLRFREQPTRAIIPDLYVEEVDGAWQVSINETPIPFFVIKDSYHPSQLTLSREERKFVSRYTQSAKWIQSSLTRRKKTLVAIGNFLIKKHKYFFEQKESMLESLTLAEVASELGLSESTIARAVADKYLSCPKGIFAIKYFFSSKASLHESSLASRSARELLQKIIRGECKEQPLSDQEIAKQMQRMGFSCARRTITKYRQSLKIAPASKRKV